MYQNLLVPLDGSLFAEHALPVAASIAKRCGGSIELARVETKLHSLELPPELADNEFARASADARAYLEETAQRLRAAAQVPVTTSLLEGRVAQALHDRSAAAGVDLIVLTSHGRGPISRMWLGSVADQLIREAPCPLLLVRPGETPPDLSRDFAVRHVLIPLDGSKFAEQILKPAMALGEHMKADFRLLRVVQPVMVGGFEHVTTAVSGPQASLVGFLETEARRYIARAGQIFQERSLAATQHVAMHVQPATAILQDAEAHGTDLIALATHGYRGPARFFLGSVADKVVRGASCAVLLYRPLDQ
jgi:nucleotide-binding universal stress UspA family protein